MPRVEVPDRYANSPRYCPVCETGSESFGKYGDAQVPDARCPNCTTMERYRLLYLYLKNETDFFSNEKTVLDIAPRREFSAVCKRSQNLKYISIDKYSPRAMVRADVTAMALTANAFNVIFFYHVLEHVPEESTLAEIHRVLKPGGELYVQVPIDISRNSTFEVPGATPDQFENLYGQNDHVRVYGNNFEEILVGAGFRVKRRKYVEEFTKEEQIRFGLKDTYRLKNYTTCEDIFIASK